MLDIVIGLQWGDEGKGKIVDTLAPNYDIVARFQGGPNAGHTIYVDGKPLVTHQIPSSIFHQDVLSVIGDGVVVNLQTLQEELEMVQENGGFVENLRIGAGVNLILPSHIMLDGGSESALGSKKIGTTGRGIGPVHEDRPGRRGIRITDLRDYAVCEKKITELCERHIVIAHALGYDFDEEEIRHQTRMYLEVLKELTYFLIGKMIDCPSFFFKHRNSKILAEGAQGCLLDVMYGPVPDVTSSNVISSSACIGLGIPPTRANKIIGVFKAYLTKVGSGIFPTIQNGDIGSVLQKRGGEFGATTGRPRDCGFLDMPALRYACIINGVTDLIMTKADVLFGADIPVSVGMYYTLKNGSTVNLFDPNMLLDIERVEYREFGKLPCLKGSTSIVHPAELDQYYSFIEDQLIDNGLKISQISVGPNRQDILTV